MRKNFPLLIQVLKPNLVCLLCHFPNLQDDSIVDPSPIDHITFSPQAATDSHPSVTISLPLRHSTRNKNPPVWLSDFVTNQVTKTTSLVLPIHTLSNAHVNFLANLSHVKEPYDVACKCLHWVQAMQEEIKALEQNKT